VAHDDRLAAPEVEPGHGVLVGHAAAEAEDIDYGLLVTRVVPESCPTQCRAEGGVMDRDDSAVAAGLVMADDDLLVAHLCDRVEEVHVMAERKVVMGIRTGNR